MGSTGRWRVSFGGSPKPPDRLKSCPASRRTRHAGRVRSPRQTHACPGADSLAPLRRQRNTAATRPQSRRPAAAPPASESGHIAGVARSPAPTTTSPTAAGSAVPHPTPRMLWERYPPPGGRGRGDSRRSLFDRACGSGAQPRGVLVVAGRRRGSPNHINGPAQKCGRNQTPDPRRDCSPGPVHFSHSTAPGSRDGTCSAHGG
jgi:hypothetical protein